MPSLPLAAATDRQLRHSGVGRTLRVVAREVVRAGALLTSPLRPLPDFLIIGAKRGGTTSMYRYLLRHPSVLPMFPSARRLPLAADPKGVHYFDTQYRLPLAWYRSHFPSSLARSAAERHSGERVICGEASPYYLFHPRAADRAAATVPAARLVLLLRDPVERTYSHYREQRRNGVERLSFDAALAAEAERLAAARAAAGEAWADTFAAEHQGYVAQSEYAPAVVRWLSRYPRSQLLVVRSEDFYAAPQVAYDAVLEFLSLAPFRLVDVSSWNSAPGSPMSPSTRNSLRAHFAPYDAELEALLGCHLGWSEDVR